METCSNSVCFEYNYSFKKYFRPILSIEINLKKILTIITVILLS